MSRYPQSSGILVSPYELGYTQPSKVELSLRRRTQNHHGFWPRRNYETRVQSVFRNLVSNVYPMLVEEHNGNSGLHDRYDPPRMPSEVQMIDVLEQYIAENGVIHAVHEKRTNPPT
jgi:hypothetical protein